MDLKTGFNRAAILIGFIGFVIGFFSGASEGDFVWGVVGAAIFGLLGFIVVKLIGWMVIGFKGNK